MARRGVPNEDLSNIEFETSEEVEVVPTFNSMVCVCVLLIVVNCILCIYRVIPHKTANHFNCN